MRIFRLPIIVLAVLVVIVAAIWASRRPLTEAVVARWFAGQQVDARYRVESISPSEVVLGAVSLGPVARPEFTAERLVARVGWSPLRPRVDTVTLLRPRLRATWSSRGLSLGSLDRLLPRSDKPEPLPDIDVRLVDGRVSLATPYGAISGRGDGAGRLRGGFDGVLRVDPVQLAAGGCDIASYGGKLRIVTARDRIDLVANGSAPQLACGAEFAAQNVDWRVVLAFPAVIDRYRGEFEFDAARVRAPGHAAGPVELHGSLDAASLGAPISGTFDAGARAVVGAASARVAGASGSYSFTPSTGLATIDARLSVEGGRLRFPRAELANIVRRSSGTLVAPLVERLGARSAVAASDFAATARVGVRRDKAGITAELQQLEARATSGLRVRQTGRAMLNRGGAVELAGGLTVAGGGLPVMAVDGTGTLRAGRLTGAARASLAPWSVPGASIAVPRLDLRANDGGVAVAGRVTVSGLLGGGIGAAALALPLALQVGRDGSVGITECVAVEWASLRRGSVLLAPARARICPSRGLSFRNASLSGGGVVDALALRGTADGTAFTMTSAPLRLAVARNTAQLAPARVALRYGERNLAATLSGSLGFATMAGAGRIADGSYDDAAAPVNIARVDATWRLASGRLELAAGTARITDRTAPARFEPLSISGATATLAHGRIDGRGGVLLASNGARLADFTARHDLATARGSADLATGTLVFGPALQPYQITENLRGIVENVRGPVVGTGRVDWVGTKLTSRGALRIDKLALATAALGPVDGIEGSFEFTDLLTLTTRPGQRLRIARINPGIAVDDGVVLFRMLAPDAAAIESIVWPYAGGTLTLAPVAIRAGDLRRDFRLTVAGLDAEQFLQKFEIKNLNVTGRFDGVLPLVFDEGSGRIVAGKLVAQTGGLVQYVGDVANADLGAGARLAFDALRRLRYRELTLDLDGDLDGELVTQLRFAGTNEAATTLGGGPLPIRATGLPFKFNVTVRAPFRALLGTAASFSDVRPLIRGEQVQPR